MGGSLENEARRRVLSECFLFHTETESPLATSYSSPPPVDSVSHISKGSIPHKTLSLLQVSSHGCFLLELSIAYVFCFMSSLIFYCQVFFLCMKCCIINVLHLCKHSDYDPAVNLVDITYARFILNKQLKMFRYLLHVSSLEGTRFKLTTMLPLSGP